MRSLCRAGPWAVLLLCHKWQDKEIQSGFKSKIRYDGSGQYHLFHESWFSVQLQKSTAKYFHESWKIESLDSFHRNLPGACTSF